MSTRLEYADARYVTLDYLDERLLQAAEDPQAQNVLVLWHGGSEATVLTGTEEELRTLAHNIVAILDDGPTAYVEPDDEEDPDEVRQRIIDTFEEDRG